MFVPELLVGVRWETSRFGFRAPGKNTNACFKGWEAVCLFLTREAAVWQGGGASGETLPSARGESDCVQTQHGASSATAQQTRKGSDRNGIFLVPSDVQLALTPGSWPRSDPVLLSSTWMSEENTTFLLWQIEQQICCHFYSRLHHNF